MKYRKDWLRRLLLLRIKTLRQRKYLSLFCNNAFTRQSSRFVDHASRQAPHLHPLASQVAETKQCNGEELEPGNGAIATCCNTNNDQDAVSPCVTQSYNESERIHAQLRIETLRQGIFSRHPFVGQNSCPIISYDWLMQRIAAQNPVQEIQTAGVPTDPKISANALDLVAAAFQLEAGPCPKTSRSSSGGSPGFKTIGARKSMSAPHKTTKPMRLRPVKL